MSVALSIMLDQALNNDNDLKVESDEKIAGATGVVVVADDPAAPSKVVSSGRQRLSDLFTIVCTANFTYPQRTQRKVLMHGSFVQASR